MLGELEFEKTGRVVPYKPSGEVACQGEVLEYQRLIDRHGQTNILCEGCKEIFETRWSRLMTCPKCGMVYKIEEDE